MMSLYKRRAWLLTVLLVLVGGTLSASPALAYGPSVLAAPSGDCTRPYCFTYAKSAQLPSGRLVATYEDNNQPLENMTFPIWSSTDNGKSWKRRSSVADTSPRRWGNWTNPNLYVLPQRIGTMPAGTLLLAGISSPPDRSATAIQLYRSNDEGSTWRWISEVALGGGQWGSPNPTPIWEPYLLVANNRLIVYYSDERDKTSHDQKIVHQSSTDGVRWGPVVDDVAMADRALRPGMPIVTRTADGRYLMVYEMVGKPDTPNNFKISADPESWNAGDGGTTIDHGGSPMVITQPNGRLVYNSYGSGDVRVNTGNGAGPWTPVHTTMPRGYSRMLQPVAGTGRVLILSVEGFWVSGRNTVRYGDVDLGQSAGAYYKLVNRASGKALDTAQASLQDGADLVQWPDNGGAGQQWHVTDTGGGYRTLFNRNSGRVLSIWGTSTADNARAVQWVENAGADQQWQLVPVGAYYRLVARHSGNALSVLDGSGSDGAQIVQRPYSGALDQQWRLVRVS
ncbi:RICIN domain-containing protein [Lentzea aerocolonigenes]|uniref:RICIN domain-containing protein n=1 Tax=Lentzea aerocolonigenes TaxID=68170 RepID=UPI0006985DE6|nr:RICIN domain-containing protein [Lentzea aerocolonigenes]